MDSITIALGEVEKSDLIAEKATSSNYPEPTTEQVIEVLKYLKYQEGGKEVDGMNEYMGFGNGQIAKKVGVSLESVNKIQEARLKKINELTSE